MIAACVHEGPARALIHAMKYRGVVDAAAPLVDRMIERLPGTATALVPVPRAGLRAARFGIDPAAVLASEIGRRRQLPVVSALRAPLWWPRHAAAPRSGRSGISFHQRRPVVPGSVLVDDVVTTGSTVTAAAMVLHETPALVLAATAAPRVGAGSTPVEAA